MSNEAMIPQVPGMAVEIEPSAMKMARDTNTAKQPSSAVA